MQSGKNTFFENSILIVIVLVLIQTLLEDVAVLASWPVESRRVLAILGFIFDIIFTLEFFSRSFFAISQNRFGHYVLEGRGWIDFMVSVPLLLFSSGPEFFAIVTGGFAVSFGGILQVLKVVKSIRIARILRLLRVLKIFRRIKNTETVMTQRHIARITTTVIATIVLALLLFTVVDNFLNINDVYAVYEESIQGLTQYISANSGFLTSDTQLQEAYFASIPIILMVKYDGMTLYTRYTNAEYARQWSINDYVYVQKDALELYINIWYLNVSEAKSNLYFFLMIFSVILVIMFVYSPHFALTISDPIHVMRRGFDETSYNLQVRIPDQFKDDEVYLLSESFNRDYLPMKDREGQKNQESVLTLSAVNLADLGAPSANGENGAANDDH
ncbi:MAG: ion transporter [Salinispira sp.]